MFYFAHPFGVSTPFAQLDLSGNESSTSSSTTPPQSRQNAMRQILREKCMKNDSRTTTNVNDPRLASYVPWPEKTWRRDDVLPTIVEILAKQKGMLIFFCLLKVNQFL